ncbi:30S ribosomal protein S4 [Candidatus Alkanophaga liquidiphilum]|nr:Ribosomal protein S4 or related protein [Candidatus Alkanophaga liquidiphilum]RLG38385.1 MAG: 30S ribosomal protein S4 [Candidatus Alkanophagales archaeon]
MGDPKRRRKTYETPKHPWEATRIQEEHELVEKYGLKNKREIYKALTTIKKYRREIRGISAALSSMKGSEHALKKREGILRSLKRKGILKPDGDVDDVLGLSIEDLLERRLQTIVYKKGLAKTMKQARQLIVHGHIAVAGRRVTAPSYIVSVDEEPEVRYFSEDIAERLGLT